MSLFLDGFQAALKAMLQLALIVIASGWLARRGIFTREMITGLSRGVVYVFLPCLIFDTITREFDPGVMGLWWVIPISAGLLFLIGLGVTLLLNWRTWRSGKDCLPLGFLQNAGYLSVALGKIMVPDRFSEWAVYTFLYILVHNALIWTFGKYMISSHPDQTFQLRQIITPPLIGNLMGLTLVLTGGTRWIPAPVAESVQLVGSAAIPLSLVILGGTLATTPLKLRRDSQLVFRSMLSKLVLVPAFATGLLLACPLPPQLHLLGLFWVAQAAYPQASNLIVQVQTYGGHLERVCIVLFFCYVGSLLTLPLWMGIWMSLRPIGI